MYISLLQLKSVSRSNENGAVTNIAKTLLAEFEAPMFVTFQRYNKISSERYWIFFFLLEVLS